MATRKPASKSKKPTASKKPSSTAPPKKKVPRKKPAQKARAPAGLTPVGEVRFPTGAELKQLAKRAPKALVEAWRTIGWGRFDDGFLRLTPPAALDETLAEWLGKADPTRIPLGWTALGDLLYFRDLRERARSLGLTGSEAENACDISAIDVRYKQPIVLALSVEGFFRDFLADPDALNEQLGRDLYVAARKRLGLPGVEEVYGFVPALALGGSEDPKNLQRMDGKVHLAILLQL